MTNINSIIKCPKKMFSLYIHLGRYLFSFSFYLPHSKFDKISFRDFPFVSGIINTASTALRPLNTANIVQIHLTPNCIINDGYILQIANHMRYPIVCTTPFITPVTHYCVCIYKN